MAVAPTGPPRVSLGGLPGHWGLFHGPRTGCWGQRGGTVPASTGAPRRGWSWGHGLSDPHQGWLVGRGWGVGPVLFRPTMGTTSSRRVPRWHGWTGRWETPHGCGGAGACPGLPTGGWGPALGWPRPGQGPGLRWETLGHHSTRVWGEAPRWRWGGSDGVYVRNAEVEQGVSARRRQEPRCGLGGKHGGPSGGHTKVPQWGQPAPGFLSYLVRTVTVVLVPLSRSLLFVVLLNTALRNWEPCKWRCLDSQLVFSLPAVFH